MSDMVQADIDHLFGHTEALLRDLRRLAQANLRDDKAFEEFITARNSFHETLTDLNERLYSEQDALLVPELLDETGDWDNGDGCATVEVTLVGLRLRRGGSVVDAVHDALAAGGGPFEVSEIRLR
jgi:hypothetical protein